VIVMLIEASLFTSSAGDSSVAAAMWRSKASCNRSPAAYAVQSIPVLALFLLSDFSFSSTPWG